MWSEQFYYECANRACCPYSYKEHNKTDYQYCVAAVCTCYLAWMCVNKLMDCVFHRLCVVSKLLLTSHDNLISRITSPLFFLTLCKYETSLHKICLLVLVLAPLLNFWSQVTAGLSWLFIEHGRLEPFVNKISLMLVYEMWLDIVPPTRPNRVT